MNSLIGVFVPAIIGTILKYGKVEDKNVKILTLHSLQNDTKIVSLVSFSVCREEDDDKSGTLRRLLA